MTLNDDFSFVRFLKVIKTLYESSTFTQLGKTVGSALGQQPGATNKHGDGTDEEETYGNVSYKPKPLRDLEESAYNESKKLSSQSTLMTVLAACTSPRGEDGKAKSGSRRERKASKDRELATIDTRDTRTPSSLVEQIITCTYAHGDEPFSDDDTYHSKGSFDEHTLEDSTFDSMTDDGYDSGRRARGRSRRRRRA